MKQAFSHLKVAYGYDTAVDDFYLNADCNTLDEPELKTIMVDNTFYQHLRDDTNASINPSPNG